MIGAQAYENLYQTTQVIDDPTLALVFEFDGVQYMYHFATACEMFDTYNEFKVWCIEDVVERHGEYADDIEVIA